MLMDSETVAFQGSFEVTDTRITPGGSVTFNECDTILYQVSRCDPYQNGTKTETTVLRMDNYRLDEAKAKI